MFHDDQLTAAGLDPRNVGRLRRQLRGAGLTQPGLPAGLADSVDLLVEVGRLAERFDVGRDGQALEALLSSDLLGNWNPEIGDPLPVPIQPPWDADTPHPWFPDGSLCPNLVVGQTRIMTATAAVDIAAGRLDLPNVTRVRNLAIGLNARFDGRVGGILPPENGGGFPYAPDDGIRPGLPNGFPGLDPCGFQQLDCANRGYGYLEELTAWQTATGRDLNDPYPRIGAITPNCTTLAKAADTTFVVTPPPGEHLPHSSWVLTFDGEPISTRRESSQEMTFRLEDLPGEGCRSGWIRFEDSNPPPPSPGGAPGCLPIGAPTDVFAPLLPPGAFGLPFEIFDDVVVYAIAIDGQPVPSPNDVDTLVTPHCGGTTVDIRYGACEGQPSLGCARFSTEVSVGDGLPPATITTADDTGEVVRIVVDGCVDEFTVHTKLWPHGDPDSIITGSRTYRIERRPKLAIEMVEPATGRVVALPETDADAPTIVAERPRLLRIHTTCCPTFAGIEVHVVAIGLDLDIEGEIRIPHGATFVDVPFVGLDLGAEGAVVIDVSADGHASANGVVHLLRPVLGLALSGGGAKGSFHAGALAYLRDGSLFGRFSDSPARYDVVTGTSVGAITGAKLAEGRRRGVDEMVEVWLELDGTGDMVQAARWLDRARNEIRNGLGADSVPGLPDCHPFIPHPEINPTRARRRKLKWYEVALAVLTAPFRVFIDAANYLARQVKNAWDSILKLWWIITEAEDLVEDLIDSFCEESGLLSLDPAMDIVRQRVDPRRVRGSGIELRLLAVDATSGRTMAFTQNGVLLDPGEQPTADDADDVAIAQTGSEPLITAVRASSAQPVIHETPIVGLVGDDKRMYDGGVREIIPAVAAVRAGADDVIVIDLSPTSTRRDDVALLGGLRTTLERGLDLATTEVEFGDRHGVAHLPDVRVTHIAPSVLVSSPYEIDQGRVRINMMHGWLRAHDALLAERGATAEELRIAAETTAQLTELRLNVWFCEEQLLQWRADKLDSEELMTIILEAKRAIHRTAQKRVNALSITSLPAGFGSIPATRERLTDWWLRWELHSVFDAELDGPRPPIFDGSGERPPPSQLTP